MSLRATVLVIGLSLAAWDAGAADDTEPWGLRRGADGGWSLYNDGQLQVQPTLTMQGAGFWQHNPWWGESREVLGDQADRWGEGSIEPGVTLRRTLGSAGSLEGRYSYLGVWTRGGIDATGGNFPDENVESGLVEDLYLKWRSGDLLPALGEDGLEVSFGRQDYQVGDGFVFALGGTSGGSRGGYWLAARSAFRHTAIARVSTGALVAEAVYLSPADSPDSHTRIAGLNVDYDLGELGGLGFGYFNLYDSDIRLRDGMSVFDARVRLTPFRALRELSFSGEYVYEHNSDRLRAFGYYGEAAYEWKQLRGTPLVSYRFAFFSGDTGDASTSRAFDPLFYGLTDWGTWYQGEIFGEYVLLNQNLMTHRARLRVEASKSITVNLLYYHLRLDERPTAIASRTEPRLAAVRSKHLGDEVNLVVDWAVRDWLSVSAVTAVAFPGDAAKEFAGDDADWVSAMLLVVLHF